MSKKFFFQSEKKLSLISYLLNGIVKSKEYHLILVSCYFNLDSAKELIEILQGESIILSKISIYIDRATAINIGKEKITKWIDQLPSTLNICFKIVSAGSLFHAKAYCLVADDITTGSLVIGSANLTGKGLTSSNGNIELLYDTHNLEDIHCFCEDLFNSNELKFIEISELEEFNNTDSDYFKYAILQEGYFVRSYNVTINDLLSFKYRFNAKGQKESKSNAFRSLGLKDKNSYSYNYFEDIQEVIKNILLKYNPSYDVDWGDYGIQTEFGHWIPKHIVGYLNKENQEEKNRLKSCKEEIEKELSSSLDIAKDKMVIQWKELLDKDWLTSTFKPLNTEIYNGNIDEYIKRETNKILNTKITNFLKNTDKLLFRYYSLKIPFDFTDIEEIKNLFIFLEESCIKKIGENSYSSIKKNQDINESIERIFSYYFEINNNILFYYLSLSIRTQQLRFIRCLSREFFIDYVNKKSTDTKTSQRKIGSAMQLVTEE